ncbi:MAG: helix-turn-helix domain-containing protein [Bacteroidaceae bacterium]|nr:helix-turn-helix domain-containing protein [Bacteroidaceae bacterium]
MKTDLELVNICVLNAGYAQVSQHWEGKGLSSPFARLYYVKEGEGTITLPEAELTMKAGNMYLVPSFMPHSMTCQSGLKFYYLFVYERYGQQSDVFDLYSFPYEVEANQAIDLLFENYCSYYPELTLPYASAEDFYAHPSYREYAIRYTQMDRSQKMQLQGFVWIVASFFMAKAQKIEEVDERLLRVIGYVKENVAREIEIETLAGMVCLTKSHLERLFREKLGTSPLQYILRTKIQCAQRLLMTTGYSVNVIAHEVGFDDPSYFIRIFRQKIGFTPQEYRVNLK